MRIALRRVGMLGLTLVMAASFGCGGSGGGSGAGGSGGSDTPTEGGGHTERAPAPPAGQAEAVFAGGCFWCMETAFEGVEGVISATSGYTGGHVDGPSYEEVSSGGTGHAESVRVAYDPARISYEQLLEIYWHNVDPTQADGQFCDHGTQYRSAIFPRDEEQRRLAEETRRQVAQTLGRPVVTTIEDPAPFWVAEDYHQDFYRTHPARYHSYRLGCGRDRRLEELWGEAAGH